VVIQWPQGNFQMVGHVLGESLTLKMGILNLISICRIGSY
jgi:hypothetical protein